MKYTRALAPALTIALILAASFAAAQVAAPQRQRPLTGLILSTVDDTFVVVDSAGNQTTVKINPGTLFEINRSAASRPMTIKRGVRVRVNFTSDGIAQTISGYGASGQLTEPQVKAFLAVTDAEWTELSPRIEKILTLQTQAADPVLAANTGFNTRFANNAPPVAASPAQQAEVSMRTAYFDNDAAPADLADTVKAYRAAKTQSRADLASARKDLQDIVTPRQEALLVIVGVLE